MDMIHFVYGLDDNYWLLTAGAAASAAFETKLEVVRRVKGRFKSNI